MSRVVAKEQQLIVWRASAIKIVQERFRRGKILKAANQTQECRRQQKIRNRSVLDGFGEILLVRNLKAELVIILISD